MVPDIENRVSFFIIDKLYKYKYNFPETFVFRNNYVRKCTGKSYGIFSKSILY